MKISPAGSVSLTSVVVVHVASVSGSPAYIVSGLNSSFRQLTSPSSWVLQFLLNKTPIQQFCGSFNLIYSLLYIDQNKVLSKICL